jgi:hypothetical protein
MRIGPVMQEVINFVDKNPGCTKLAAALHSGPGPHRPRNLRHAYAPVDRAIARGLINARRKPNGHYMLFRAMDDQEITAQWASYKDVGHTYSVTGNDLEHLTNS